MAQALGLTLTHFGAFYEDDKEEGFSFTFNRSSGFTLADIAQYETLFMEKRHFIVDKIKNREDMSSVTVLDELWKTLFSCIKEHNDKAYPNGRIGAPTTVQKIAKDDLVLLSKIFLTIAILEDVGEIKADDHNGMLYAYESGL